MASQADFYQRKILRLESDIAILHEELTAARLRLRTAEDFEIKYQLLLRQSQSENQRLKMLERMEEQKRDEISIILLKENDQKWKAALEENDESWKKKYQQVEKDVQDKLEEKYLSEVSALKERNDQITKRFNDLNLKKEEMELFNFKLKKFQKQNEFLREQIEQIKDHNQKQKEEELSNLRALLNQSYRQKLSNERKNWEEKIEMLEKTISGLENENDKIRTAPPSLESSEQLQKLKNLIEQKNHDHSAKLDALSKNLQQKNTQIKSILNEREKDNDQHRNQIKELKEYIKTLEEKLILKDKEHDTEIFNVIERAKKIKQEEINELKNQIQRMNHDFQTEKNVWDHAISAHKDQLAKIKKLWDDDKAKLLQEKNHHKKKISELSARLKEFESNQQMGETQMLINSLKQIDFKEDQMGNYENGITFLERQVKKSTLKLEQRNRQINKLVKDMNDLRNETDLQMNDLKEKHRKQKKEYTQKITELQHELKDLNDLLRMRERDLKKKEKDTNNEKLELQAQNNSLKEFIQQLQRDYNRVIENKKYVETSYRQERQKGISSKGDLNLVKKQKFLELQKQKNELQIIFRQKQEQLKLQYQIQVDDLRKKVDQLKQRCQIVDKENELLKKENNKLLEIKQQTKQNDKFAEYNKKMATLNLEIALTQNLYDSLVQAKSRIHHEDIARSEGQISESHDEPKKQEGDLMISFNPAANFR